MAKKSLIKKQGISSSALNREILVKEQDAVETNERQTISPDKASLALDLVNKPNQISVAPIPNVGERYVNDTQGCLVTLSSGDKTYAKLVKVDPNEIGLDFEGNKRNLTEEKVKSLVPLLIESNGNSQPYYIRLHPDKDSKYKYQAITGKRRTLASRIAKTQSYCMLLVASDDDSVVLASHENEGREDFTVFERADQIQALIDVIGNKKKAISIFNKQTGKKISRTHSYDLVLPSKVPNEIRELIDDSGDIQIAQIKKLLNQLTKLNEELDVNERAKFIASIGPNVPILNLVSLIKDKLSSLTGGIEEQEDKNKEPKQFLNKTGKSVATFDFKSSTLKLNKNASNELIEKLLHLISEEVNNAE